MHPLQKTSWHPLPLSSPIRSAPPLLIQTHFTSSSYTVHLTDLTRIWSESLSKREILSLAEKEDTSIDPSEDAGQLRVLLQRLEQSLIKVDNDIDVELSSLEPKNDQKTGELRLKTIHVLPSPLRSLVWTFRLKPMEIVQFTNLFVLPLIGLASVHKEQVESLVSNLHDKDVIIAKLMEHLDGKVDIKSILGGGRARRRGLENFEVERWREDFGDGGDRRVGEVVKDVFSSGMEETGHVKALWEEADTWWRGVKGDEEEEEPKPRRSKGQSKAIKVSSPPSRNAGKQMESEPTRQIEAVMERNKAAQWSETENEEDEFEVQKTPPETHKIHPFRTTSASRSPKKKSSPTLVPPILPGKGDDDTVFQPSSLFFPHKNSAFESSATLRVNTPTPSPYPPPKTKPQIGKRGGIGKIGGSGVLTRKLKSPTPPPPKGHADNGVGTDSEEDHMIIDPKGKGKAPAESHFSTSENKPSSALLAEETESEVEKKPKPKKVGVIKSIGKIGGNKCVPKPKREDDDDYFVDNNSFDGRNSIDAGPFGRVKYPSSPSPPPPKARTPTPEEDEDAKADRKRRQLVKDLEAKKKAPVKKKRKF
ncbi:hypothetical protein RUND412_004300 [Rhizina undulata]